MVYKCWLGQPSVQFINALSPYLRMLESWREIWDSQPKHSRWVWDLFFTSGRCSCDKGKGPTGLLIRAALLGGTSFIRMYRLSNIWGHRWMANSLICGDNQLSYCIELPAIKIMSTTCSNILLNCMTSGWYLIFNLAVASQPHKLTYCDVDTRGSM